MSHSTVLVVIRDAENADDAEARLEELMAPFDENESVAPYPTEVSIEEVGHAVSFYREHPEYCDGEQGPAKPFDEFVTEGNLEAWHEWNRQAVGHHLGNGEGVYDAEKDTYSYMSTYNPKSKWDWYQLGGRWHGFWQVKPGIQVGSEPVPEWKQRFGPIGESIFGEATVATFNGTQRAILGGGGTGGDDPNENFAGRADLARKGDIDFYAMRNLAGLKAESEYDRFEMATNGIEPAPTWQEYVTDRFQREGRPHPWEEGFAYGEETKAIMDRCRADFAKHPWNAALRAADIHTWFTEANEEWCVRTGGRPTYVQRARDNITSTFAILMDGQWYERGRMGWWGMVSDEKELDQWSREHAALLSNLPDDVYLAVVDVHI